MLGLDGGDQQRCGAGGLRGVCRGVINGAGVPTSNRRGRLFCSSYTIKARGSTPVALRSLRQLHRYRGRRDGILRLDAESWCLATGLSLAATPKQSGFVVDERSEPTLAIAVDAVSNPTTRVHQSGGIHGDLEGSIPSSTTEYLNNDKVVQRRRAGQRSHNRPAPSSRHAQHAAVGRWLRRCSHPRSS